MSEKARKPFIGTDGNAYYAYGEDRTWTSRKRQVYLRSEPTAGSRIAFQCGTENAWIYYGVPFLSLPRETKEKQTKKEKPQQRFKLTSQGKVWYNKFKQEGKPEGG